MVTVKMTATYKFNGACSASEEFDYFGEMPSKEKLDKDLSDFLADTMREYQDTFEDGLDEGSDFGDELDSYEEPNHWNYFWEIT